MLAIKPTETLLRKSSSLLLRSMSITSDTPELPFDDKNMVSRLEPGMKKKRKLL